MDIRQIVAIVVIAAGIMLPRMGTPVTPPPSIPIDLPLSGIPAERREYFGDLYDAMAAVIERDGKRPTSGVKSILDFSALHAGALQLAVDRDQVGVYPGLGEAIDAAFASNVGDDNVQVDAAARSRLAEVCRAIAWEFRNGG